GYKGLFGWLRHLPWKDVRFLAPFIGMLAFIPGGAGGIINASHQMNAVVHNTIWVTGHFHLTIATVVMMTFFGIGFWLIPHLSGRTVTKSMNKLGIVQSMLSPVGMLFRSGWMHIQGLLGGPRRADFATDVVTEQAQTWINYRVFEAIGGTIVLIAIILLVYIDVKLAFFTAKGTEE